MMMYLVLLLALVAFHESGAQDTCTTPLNKQGTCINIRNCPPLVNILRGPRPLSPQSLELLTNSQCGFENMDPMVCCEVQTRGPPTPVPTPTPTPQAGEQSPPDVTNHPNLRLLDHSICGPVTESKIFGGNKTGIYDYPWMALIAYDTGKRVPEFRCGGTVLNKRYILTAAHCLAGLPAGLSVNGVRVGEHDLSKERDCDIGEDGLEVVCAEKYQDFGIESMYVHPEYSRRGLRNDIALLRVNSDIDFRPDNVKPICMPIGSAATMSQRTVIVTGWGATELGPRSQDLLKVQLVPVPNEQCKEAYKRNVEIWYKQMCAGGTRNMDSCSGDSGGPLQAPGIYENRSVRFIQYGIVSFGLRSCGVEGFPGVYTRLTYYLDWVLDTIRA